LTGSPLTLRFWVKNVISGKKQLCHLIPLIKTYILMCRTPPTRVVIIPQMTGQWPFIASKMALCPANGRTNFQVLAGPRPTADWGRRPDIPIWPPGGRSRSRPWPTGGRRCRLDFGWARRAAEGWAEGSARLFWWPAGGRIVYRPSSSVDRGR